MKSGLNLQGAQARLRFLVSEILLNCAKKVLFFESRASAPCRFSCCQLCEIFSFFFPERIFTFLVSIFLTTRRPLFQKRGVFFSKKRGVFKKEGCFFPISTHFQKRGVFFLCDEIEKTQSNFAQKKQEIVFSRRSIVDVNYTKTLRCW